MHETAGDSFSCGRFSFATHTDPQLTVLAITTVFHKFAFTPMSRFQMGWAAAVDSDSILMSVDGGEPWWATATLPDTVFVRPNPA